MVEAGIGDDLELAHAFFRCAGDAGEQHRRADGAPRGRAISRLRQTVRGHEVVDLESDRREGSCVEEGAVVGHDVAEQLARFLTVSRDREPYPGDAIEGPIGMFRGAQRALDRREHDRRGPRRRDHRPAPIADLARQLQQLVADRHDPYRDVPTPRRETQEGLLGPSIDRTGARGVLTAQEASHQGRCLTGARDDITAVDADPPQRVDVVSTHAQRDAGRRQMVERRDVRRDLARIGRVDGTADVDLDAARRARGRRGQCPAVRAERAVRKNQPVEAELVRECRQIDKLARAAEVVDEADAESHRVTARRAIGAATRRPPAKSTAPARRNGASTPRPTKSELSVGPTIPARYSGR